MHCWYKLVNFVNSEPKKVARWLYSNKMAVNVSKTKFLIFHTKGKRNNSDIQLKCDDNEPDSNDLNLKYVVERYHFGHPNVKYRSYKILGVYIDKHQTFDHHVQCNISFPKSTACFIASTELKTCFHPLH